MNSSCEVPNNLREKISWMETRDKGLNPAGTSKKEIIWTYHFLSQPNKSWRNACHAMAMLRPSFTFRDIPSILSKYSYVASFLFNSTLIDFSFKVSKSYLQSDLHQGLPICPRLFSFFLSFSMKFNANWTCHLVTFTTKMWSNRFPERNREETKIDMETACSSYPASQIGHAKDD